MPLRFAAISFVALAFSACSEPEVDPAAEETQALSPVETETLAADKQPALFAQCSVCHGVEPDKKGIGPTLAGVFDAKAGHVGDYAYSTAMRESGLTWNEVSLDRYLENPRTTVPGTKMSFAGMRKAEDRAQLIEYLKTL